jgi:hypothetical protein
MNLAKRRSADFSSKKSTLRRQRECAMFAPLLPVLGPWWSVFWRGSPEQVTRLKPSQSD